MHQITRWAVMAFLTLGAALMSTVVSTSTSYADEGFELRIVQGVNFDSLDPPLNGSTPTQIILRQIFNTLVKWDGPSMSKIVPDLAESWQSSEDGLTWTFKLREGVRFTDGTPLNAEAVKFSLDRLRSEELGSPNRSQVSDIVDVIAVDELTVDIVTNSPSPTLFEKLAEVYASINSPTAIMSNPDSYAQNPVGTGPYKLTEFILGDSLTIERNSSYFGTPGKALRMTFRPVPEAAARAIELQTGNADIAFNIAPESAGQIRAGDDIELLVEPSSFQIFMELNTAKPPFDDPRARLAVNYAVDRAAIIEKVLQGYGAIPTGIFPAGIQGRVEQDPYPFDPERAKALWAEVFPNGYDESIVIWTPNGRYPKDQTIAEIVQSYLNEIGLKTEFRVWDWASYTKTLYNPNPGVGTGKGSNAANMWLFGTGIAQADYRTRRKFYSTHASNLTGYNNSAVDVLLDKAAVELDYDKRMAYFGELQEIVWNEAPNALTLFNGVQLIGVGGGVSGLQVYSTEFVDLSQVSKE